MVDQLGEKQVNRNDNLDFIKIVACIAVVGLHTLYDLPVINRLLYGACGFAVPAFLMSAGYILLNRSEVSYRYSFHKIKKIFRIVFIWSLLIFIVDLMMRVRSDEYSLQAIMVLPNTFLRGLAQGGVLWHFWYLGMLILIYALYPFIMRCRRHLLWLWMISALVGAVLQVMSYCIGIPVQSYVIQTFRMWTWLQYFVLGGLLGGNLNKLHVSVRKRAVVCILFTIAAVCYQYVMGNRFLHNYYAEFFYDSVLTIMWLISIYCFFMGIKWSGKVKGVIQKFAPITMGVYIVHPLVMRLLQSFVVVDSPGMSCMFFFVVLIASGTCAYYMHKVPFVKKWIEL